MIFQDVARVSDGSFLYSGCYDARGGLSVAQRAAWGLHVRCGQSSDQQLCKSVVTALHHPPCVGENVFTIRVKSKPRGTAARAVIKCENDGRHRFTCLPPSAEKQRRFVPRSRQLPGRGACPVVPYRRLCVIASGQQLICTVFRGRAYVASVFALEGRLA